MRSTKLLMADHAVIKEALLVLDAITTEVAHGKDMDTEDLHALLVFLREFADGCHHVKEEAIFFPALMQAGLPLDQGPLRVMTYEHQRGRVLIAAMQEAIERKIPEDFIMYAKRYRDLLDEHIEKENWILFERADQFLSGEQDEKVVSAFNQFETTVGNQTLQRFHDSIAALASKYLALAAH